MFTTACCWIAAVLATAPGTAAWAPPAPTTAVVASNASSRGPKWGTDTVDERWAAKVLADPEEDQGWTQACHDDWNDGRESHCEVREFPYHPADRLIPIRGGENGGMTVIGWDRPEVRVIYRVRARARTEERAEALAKQVELEVAKGWLEPRGPAVAKGEWWSVEMKVWVPRASDLALETHNGPAGVRGVSGTMKIRSDNGPVSLVDLAGAVQARVQNGPLHVALAGSKWSGAGLDAEAQNGPVNLVLPRGYSARLETGTVNGPMVLDYTFSVEGRFRHRFETTLGSGGPVVRVVGENGPFRIAER